jgi:glyoxylase I family protein
MGPRLGLTRFRLTTGEETRTMIRVRQLAHMCIFAHDLEETRAFYRDVLGMNTRFNFLRDGEIFGFYLDCGGRSHVEVFRKGAATYSDNDQINHFCLEVESIDAAIAHIRSKGGAVTDKKYACDDTWQAWARDPNNVKIELFEYTGKSAQFAGDDRVADW